MIVRSLLSADCKIEPFCSGGQVRSYSVQSLCGLDAISPTLFVVSGTTD